MRKTAADESCASHNFYTVRRGESLGSIARRLKVTPGALIEKNPYVDPRTLQSGIVLVVPERSRTVFARYGQTLFDILRRYNIAYQAFFEANPQLVSEVLAPGCRLSIPPYGSCGVCPESFYVVRPDDTVERVAERFSLTPLALLRLNPNLAPESLLPAQLIRIR